ncbi:unnamed protein product [Linum trigynum]|uniref:Uncharacterized protein n=1 Tax=Linum trigynum TaxID=586398 RepID=A0AAV2GNW7_9ROSI
MVDFDRCSRRTNSSPTKLREAPLSTRATAHSSTTCARNHIVGDPVVSTVVTTGMVSCPATLASSSSATCVSSCLITVMTRGTRPSAIAFTLPTATRMSSATRLSRASTSSSRASFCVAWSPFKSFDQLMSSQALIPIARNTYVSIGIGDEDKRIRIEN